MRRQKATPLFDNKHCERRRLQYETIECFFVNMFTVIGSDTTSAYSEDID